MLFLVGNRGVGIEIFPERKKHVLTVIDGVEHTKVACFSNQEGAELFADYLVRMFVALGVKTIKEGENEA